MYINIIIIFSLKKKKKTMKISGIKNMLEGYADKMCRMCNASGHEEEVDKGHTDDNHSL